jgi:branched-chain amino acid transport system permease protein
VSDARVVLRRWDRIRRIDSTIYGVVLLGLLTLYFFTFVRGVNLFVFNVVLLTSLGAIALNVLMGTAGQMSIGNAAFLAVGGFTTIWAHRAGVPMPLDIIIGTVASAVVGGIVALPAIRLRGLYLALSTLALQFIVVFVGERYQSHAVGFAGFFVTPTFASKGLDGGQRYWAWVLFIILALTILGARRVMKYRSGRAWRMIRDHEDGAPLLGIPVTRYKLKIWMLSSALIGLQGGITLYFSGGITYETFTLALAVRYVAMVLIGGVDSLAGAVAGAAILGALPTIVPKIVSAIGGSGFAQRQGPPTSQIVFGVLLVIFVISSPDGLAGIVRRLAKRRRGERDDSDGDVSERRSRSVPAMRVHNEVPLADHPAPAREVDPAVDTR